MSFNAYVRLMRLEKPIGTYLVLWPALWALWLASEAIPSYEFLIIFTLGAFVMRSAGCVINDFADRHWDGEVERTANRPLATGEISPKNALKLFAGLVVLAIVLVLFLNWQTILWSVGALVLAVLYPFTKRFTHWPQLFLGAAFAWPIPMAFAAVTTQVPLEAWLIFATAMVWTLIYDTVYAISDMPDDLKAGIKSTAVLFGKYNVLIISLLQALMLGLLIAQGFVFELANYYYFSLALVSLMFAHQLWLIKDLDRQKSFHAFKLSHWAGVVVLGGIILSYL